MIHNYSIINDTANGLYGDILEVSIKNSEIKKALRNIVVNGDVISITFKEELDTTDKVILDAIINAHDGSNQQTESILKFQESIPQGGERVTDRGFDFVAVAGEETTFDYEVTEDLFVKDGFALAYDFDKTDKVSMSIAHPLAGVIHSYLGNLPLEPHVSDKTIGKATASNKAITEVNLKGLILRMKYKSNGLTDVYVCVTMRAYS